MTILNLNNDLNFELPFQDGGFDEYIRAIDISEDEKATVLSMMNDEFEAELEDLGLEQSNPELFAKLKGIYDKMAREAEEKQWLWIGFRDGAFEYDVDLLMEHCQANCGFVFEGTQQDFEDEYEYCYSWKYRNPPSSAEEEKKVSDRLMEDISEEVYLEDYIPRYLNQAIQFTGEDMGGDRAMMLILLYIVIAIIDHTNWNIDFLLCQSFSLYPSHFFHLKFFVWLAKT